GSALALALVVLSQQFVWDIRVTGNVDMTRAQVLEELRNCGFSVGSYLPDVQASGLENRVLLSSDRIAWISVNLEGTVANVQIVERTAPPAEESHKPANLIAAADGQIELVELYRGNPVVKMGQAVRQGDLLVSGLYDSQTLGYRYTRAAGKVLARTERSYRVEIPLVYEEKVYQEAEYGEILLNFFDFSIKIYKSTGNWGASCDIIEKEKGFDLFFGSTLPLSLTVVEELPYTVQSATRTPEQAARLAYAELERELATLSASAQLLEKRMTATLTEDALILDCVVKCMEDIALQVEFEITD
ncbi:MAG: sporulation protein YqfD, partial [Clostridia bacterium]|nr:sporulation protein YqfD [Clostridia bacterium]